MKVSDLYGLWFLVFRFLSVNLMLRVHGFQGSGFLVSRLFGVCGVHYFPSGLGFFGLGGLVCSVESFLGLGVWGLGLGFSGFGALGFRFLGFRVCVYSVCRV